MVEGKAAVKEIKKFLDKVKPDLIMNKVPEKTLKEFKEWCKEEFCDHYGMGLKWLWDFFKGMLGTGTERTEAMASEALERIGRLEQKPEQEKVITNVAGQEMKVK